MPISTFLALELKRMTQIIQISNMAALEQQPAIKFCVASKKSRQETFEMIITALGNNAMMKTALYKWSSKFEQGDNSVTDEPRPGRPSSISTKKIATVKELFDCDRRMTI